MSENKVLKVEIENKLEKSSLPGIGLIVVGLIILAYNVFHIHMTAFVWPGFVIGAGLLMLWPAYQSTADHDHSLSFLAIPGAVVTTAGILFVLMTLTSHFASTAYVWPLYLAAGAAGYSYMNRFDQNEQRAEKIYRFIRTMVILFMVLAVFFELVVFQGLGSWWPIILVGLGIYLLVKNKRSESNE